MRLTGAGTGVRAVLIAALACATLVRPARAADKVDFARDVQPILADNCYFCHGPDAGHRKADLRFDKLDPKEGPFAARDGYVIVSPGKVDDSLLISRITDDDPEVHMPPPASHRKLTPKQIETLTKWVASGAKWGKHWSLEPPVRPPLPEVKDPNWCRNDIDRFILARLEKEGLTPSPDAPKETLIRRVTLDLTGLPPTPAEVDAFVADTSPDAYEKLVDRLLASPRYGEHMVWSWLDAARYADTNGYQADPTRTMWPWRDWVVRSFNDNLPYDQFVIWQIAGDLLPNRTRDQQLASAFNRNHPFNGEGGRIAEETRVENVLDRTDTVGTVFLGLTIGCAKCHDHKYDPITQKEYYSLSAYFNQSSETGRAKYADNGGNVPPVMELLSTEQAGKLVALKKAAKDAEEHVAAITKTLDAKQAEWEKSAAADDKGWTVIRPAAAKSQRGASMQVLDADDSVLVSGKSPDTDVHEVVLRTDMPRIAGIRLDALPDVSLPHGGPGRSPDSGNFVLTDLEGDAVSTADGKTVKLKFAAADATYTQQSFSAAGVIDDDPVKTGWAVWKAPDKSNVSAFFALAEPIATPGGTEVRLRFHYAWPNNKQHTMGRFRLSLTAGAVVPPDVAEALSAAADKRTDGQKTRLRDFYRSRVNPDYKAAAEAAAAAKKAAEEYDKSLTRVMVMDDATPRKTYVLAKGAYDKHEDEVSAGVPAVLNPLPTGAKNDRLALAKWFVDPANPLTARVAVNRFWQQFFGVGIVKTVEDFGVMGERPVHPELLDCLAVDFREHGWDVKRLVREIVTSRTYRQSSKVTPESFERDPENRLLARGPRFRMPAIEIRDQALAASGLLVEKLGGPPVKPYQPPGVWEEATFGTIKYVQDHGDALYRRSLYTFWRRIVGPTEFFDEPGRSTCLVRPSRTNTPLHALTTLNDTTFVEAARALARRVMETGGSTADDRLDAAYRLVLARRPSEKERVVFTAALKRLESQYAGDRPAALKLLAVGESKRDEKLDPVEHAAYTGVCLAILNLDEALTKE